MVQTNYSYTEVQNKQKTRCDYMSIISKLDPKKKEKTLSREEGKQDKGVYPCSVELERMLMYPARPSEITGDLLK